MHAVVCTCRDCGVTRLGSIMDGMSDSEGKLAVALAGVKVAMEPMRVENVALPYEAVLAVALELEERIDHLQELLDEGLNDPHSGPAADLVSEIQAGIGVLKRSWRSG